MNAPRIAAAAAIVLFAGGVRAGPLDERRRTTSAQLSVDAQRFVLENGLVVVLAPDPTASGVAVWTTFRAGALREPAGKTGLAHLVEHMVFSGTTPETDYAALLEARRARALNAETGFEAMTFEVVVPPEELPVALWVMADRLTTLPPRIDGGEVERQRRVVQQERALRFVDAPYGAVEEQLFRRLYAPPHPLRGGVIGVPDELAAVGADDVRRFVEQYLVPSNAILVLAGRFDPPVARALVARTMGRLPAGHAPALAALPPPGAAYIDAQPERHARQPRVTFAWRLPGTGREDAFALRLGAQLLTYFVDGAWGMQIGAGVIEYEGEALFEMELTVPYDEPMQTVHADADGFLRMLTHKEMPLEFLIAANLALDRFALSRLDGPEGRARVLTELELRTGGRMTLPEYLGFHWQLDGGILRDTARRHLKGPRLVVHARPERPKKARAERE
jgi:predicted Zn-dependent peptidase